MKQKYALLAVVVVLFSGTGKTSAAFVIGNLNQLWTAQGAGDFETVLPNSGYGFMFTTGASSSTLSTVTFEQVAGPGNLQVQLYTVLGNPLTDDTPNLVPVGQLGNPTVDPRATQFPTYTAFFDYTPLTPILLAANTTYLIGAVEPANGTASTALTFIPNASYLVSGGWSAYPEFSTWEYLGPTSGPGPPTPSGWMTGLIPDGMMVEIDVTPAPEPGSFALLLTGCALLGGGRLLCGVEQH